MLYRTHPTIKQFLKQAVCKLMKISLGSCNNTVIAEVNKHWGGPKVIWTLNGGSLGHFQEKMIRTVLTFKLVTSLMGQ